MRSLPSPFDKAPAIAEVVGAYYSVRTGHDYGYGKDFDMTERAEAVACAKEMIKPLIYSGEVSSWIKVSIETRWQVRYIDGEAMGESISSGCDSAVDRTEINLTEAEKVAKLEQSEYADKLTKPLEDGARVEVGDEMVEAKLGTIKSHWFSHSGKLHYVILFDDPELGTVNSVEHAVVQPLVEAGAMSGSDGLRG